MTADELQFPRCDFPVTGADDIATLLNDRLSDREPTSVLRLGDGEGMVLARPGSGDKTLWSAARAHFGPRVTADQIARLADLLSTAIHEADVIGVRDDVLDVDFGAENLPLRKDEFLPRFKAAFHLRPAEDDIAYPGALRLALLHRYLASHRFRRGTVFSSAWLHFQLSSRGALVEMMRARRRIGLICSRPALARALERQLALGVDYFQVPDMYSQAGVDDPVHFPDQFDRLMHALRVSSRGQLFLIGAGICGKVYCQRIKELGGIALDIGSVCDAWIDIPSRPLVFMSLFGTDGQAVPEGLLLDHQCGTA